MGNPTSSEKNQAIQPRRHGGARPGAGRKRGRPDRASADQKDTLEAKARTYTDVALASLVEIATQGESESARVTAATALLDRGYGKPRQAVEHSGTDGLPIQHQHIWKFGDREVAF